MLRRRRAILALAVLALAIALSPARTTAAGAEEDNCAAAANPIVCENALPGDKPSNWEISGVGNANLQGFATSMSVDAGETERFKIDTTASSYKIEILRLGYYNGDGARVVASNISPLAVQDQPECLKQPATGLIDCGNWGVSAEWAVPSNAVSGTYVAELTPSGSGGKSQIIFIVRNDESHAPILLQVSDATWEAYNEYGGNSLYTCTVDCPPGEPKSYKGAFAVSYNRPFSGGIVTDNGASYLWYAEYQMMLWLEENGYNITYTTSAEVARNGALLKNHKVFMSSGHDEYWSASQRANVEAAREAGVNLAFFSGNEIFWKTRWGPSTEGSNTAYRTLTTYKETHFEGPTDPEDPPTWTGAWRDPRSPKADGGEPENTLSGQQFEVNAGTAQIYMTSQYSKLRLWKNTSVASLKSGSELALGFDTLGYEWDEDVDNGFRPAGEFDLSSTTLSKLQKFTDYGSTLNEEATGTHHLTLYRAKSGALVFGAGTVQWSWGLENVNAWGEDTTDPELAPPSVAMEQFTVNLLAEMGVQPGALEAGLLPGVQSTDTTPPTSAITSPKSGEMLPESKAVTITGTATDSGGGVVAGVEVSTDNGASWHPATLSGSDEATVSWSYAWSPNHWPSTVIKSRAVDDSSNLETPSAGVPVNVSCPCSLWGSVAPVTAPLTDPNSITVGTKFTSEAGGSVTGVRFYKGSSDTGTHIGSLWTTSGTLLASATFTNETASGWQQVSFSKPVTISAGTTYIVSYLAPVGHYEATPNYFYTPPGEGSQILNSPPLHAVSASGEPVGGAFGSVNGLYTYGSANSFPTTSEEGSNYWVDVVFEPETVVAPGQVTKVSATAGTGSALVSWSAPSSGGTPTGYTITPYIGSVAQATVPVTAPATSATVTGLTAGASYTFTVTASDAVGSGPASEPSNVVIPTSAAAPSAPSEVAAVAGNGSASVSWTAPANGGAQILKYTVTPYVGSAAQTATVVSGTPPATSVTVTGLTNGSSYTFKVSATNEVGEGPQSGASSAVTPTAAPDTLFGTSTPATVDSGDSNSVELGMKFSSEVAGHVTGVRFYKASTNTGTHVGSLWSSTGTLLASATFSGETSSGWQQVTFSKAVAISANTTYVAAYLAPNGHYSDTASGFTSAVTNPPLIGLSNTTSANGVYSYTSSSVFPTSSYKATNYFVDVVFEPETVVAPGQVTKVSATAGTGSALVSWSAPSSGGTPTGYTITPYIGSVAQATVPVTAPATSATVTGLTAGASYTFTVTASDAVGSGPASEPSNVVIPTSAAAPSAPSEVAAVAGNGSASVSWTAPANGGAQILKYTVTPYVGSAAQTATVVSGTPPATSVTVTGLTNGSSYTFKVSATNEVGEGPQSGASSAVTPTAAPDTLFGTSTPATVDSGDSNSVELGMKFSSEVAGHVTGVRFYKASTNTGTHVGSLWSSTGTLLASATFSGETSSGWQQVTFSKAVAISANTTYVAAYLAPNGHYSDTASGFTSAVTNPPLIGLSNTTSANGVYSYTSSSVFPTSSYKATNYFVDVVFEPETVVAPGQVTKVSATAGTGSALVSWSAPSSGGTPTGYTITPYIGSVAQATVPVTAPATSATVTGLTAGASYTFTVTASDAVGSGPASEPSNVVIPTSAAAPSAPSEVAAVAGNGSASVSWTAPANGGAQILKYTVTPYVGSAAQTATVVSGTPPATSVTVTGLTNGSSYTFKVSATNEVGEGPQSGASSAVTPTAAPDTLFGTSTPATVDSGDSNSVELGMKFSSEVAGHVTGVRFYKASTNTGTHVGSLWSSTGTLLASATFSGETSSGWQQVTFSKAVAISANTTYVAAYLAPNGHYSDTASGFTSAVTNPPLIGLSNTTSANGVYSYTSSSVFPSSTYKATNYWVDVEFEPEP